MHARVCVCESKPTRVTYYCMLDELTRSCGGYHYIIRCTINRIPTCFVYEHNNNNINKETQSRMVPDYCLRWTLFYQLCTPARSTTTHVLLWLFINRFVEALCRFFFLFFSFFSSFFCLFCLFFFHTTYCTHSVYYCSCHVC